MRTLFWHPESEALFEEHDPEKMDNLAAQGAENVTGIALYENAWIGQTGRKIRQEPAAAYKKVVEGFLIDGRFQSCLNCDYFKNDVCQRFKVTPPPKVIFYSCDDWVPDIPF